MTPGNYVDTLDLILTYEELTPGTDDVDSDIYNEELLALKKG